MESNRLLWKVDIGWEQYGEFADLSKDYSRIHVDQDFAVKNGYEGMIGHGFLITTLLSGIYANIFPGEMSLCLKQDCNFVKPFYIFDILTFYAKNIKTNDDLIAGSGVVIHLLALP